MGSMNMMVLIGNVGKDPELKYSKTGDAFATFSLATSYGYKPQSGGDRQETTEWHRIVVWRQLAEQAGQFVKKGRKLCIVGRLQSRQYQDANNQQRTIYEIVASQMEFLDSPKDFAQTVEPVGANTTLSKGAGTKPVSRNLPSNGTVDDNMDLDDLPFPTF